VFLLSLTLNTMKTNFIILSLIFTIGIISCKSKKETTETKVETKTMVVGKTTGKISHQYRSSGCSTVIIVSSTDGDITLIPKDKLPADMDTDGTEITFNYITLRMPQPEGCTTGLPAEIKDIAKK